MTSKRACPVCGSTRCAPFAEASFDRERLNILSFASRKPPELMCLELVRCLDCDLIYATEPLDETELAALYGAAGYDSGEEGDLAAQTYGLALGQHLSRLKGRNGACEVGAGNGAFLPWLVKQGFAEVLGIEPSLSAIEAASPATRPLLREGMFDAKILSGKRLSLVCSFMTLEHLRDPGAFVAQAFDLLEPGGMIAVVVHDWKAWPNRLLGMRSPIIDIEHMQLFCRNALRTLLSKSGFENIGLESIRNRYALRYWLRLLPLPSSFRRGAGNFLDFLGLSERVLGLNVGNLLGIAFKPNTK